jgi:hypothetical protein
VDDMSKSRLSRSIDRTCHYNHSLFFFFSFWRRSIMDPSRSRCPEPAQDGQGHEHCRPGARRLIVPCE